MKTWDRAIEKKEWLQEEQDLFGDLYDIGLDTMVKEETDETISVSELDNRVFEDDNWLVSIGPVEYYCFGSLKKAMIYADKQAEYCEDDIVIRNKFGDVTAYRKWMDHAFAPGSEMRIPYRFKGIIDYECLGYYAKWKKTANIHAHMRSICLAVKNKFSSFWRR